MKLFYIATAAGLALGFIFPPPVPVEADVYSTPSGPISIPSQEDEDAADPLACPCAADASADPGGMADTAADGLRPANYDALLAYAQEHYAEGVDCTAVLDRFCRAVASLPELPQAETVTAFTCISRYESHGQDEVSPTHDYGTLQVNRCHRGSMADAGLDFEDEDDRCAWAAYMVAEQLASGDSWWQAFSPWCALRNHPEIKRQYQALMEAVE